MNFEKVSLYHIRMPLKSAFETSFGRSLSRDCVLIEVYNQGLVGVGECVADGDPGYSYETVGTALHILENFLVPALLAKGCSHPCRLPELLSFVRGHPMAKAGLEMALWDLHGKLENRSLQSMLFTEIGETVAPPRSVPVGVSVGLQASPAVLVETVGGYTQQGYSRVKLKIKPGRDVEDSQAVRLAFPNLRLQVDANSAYTLETCRALLPLDELNLLLIEQPLNEDDLWDHRILQAQMRTPVCLDESIGNARHARQALEMKACQVINIKNGRVGGITESITIHNLCQSQGIPVWCGGMLETGVGRAANLALASLPGFTLPGDISATERYYTEDITLQQFTLNPDSTIDVPGGPGLGVTVNPEMVNKYCLAKKEISQ